MSWTWLALVALGGAAGSLARGLAAWAIPAGRLPWATLLVNILGSLAIGWLIGRWGGGDGAPVRAHGFWVIGVCGGFTTFSAFSWQTFEQMHKGNWGMAAANVLLSVVLCLAATWVGWRLAR